MISKSTKAKRRHLAAYYRAVRTIRVSEIDRREGTPFYLLSLPETADRWRHLEARGWTQAMTQFRKLLQACRQRHSPRAVASTGARLAGAA